MQAPEIRDIILRGATIHMGYAAGVRIWWIEHPYVEVDDETMREASVGGNGQPLMEGCGDCLFGWQDNSQTWRSAYA